MQFGTDEDRRKADEQAARLVARFVSAGERMESAGSGAVGAGMKIGVSIIPLILLVIVLLLIF